MTEITFLCVAGTVTFRSTADGTYIMQINKAPDQELWIELVEKEVDQILSFMNLSVEWRKRRISA